MKHKEIEIKSAEFEALRHLHIWSWYMKGAREMLLRLREYFLTDEPHTRREGKVTAEDRVMNRALLDLILSSKQNVERFLLEEYEMRFTDHERDKKGRLVKCRAYFAKKVSRYEEVT